MIVFDFLTENHQIINTLTKAGIIAPHTPAHYAVYSKYIHLKSRNVPRNEIYRIIRNEFHYGRWMIWRIINDMEKEL